MLKYQKFVLALLLLSFLIIAPLGVWAGTKAVAGKHLAVAGKAAPMEGDPSPSTRPTSAPRDKTTTDESQPSGQVGSGAFERLVAKIERLLRVIIRLLFVLATVYFMWGVIAFLKAGGKEEAIAQGRQHMIWGIIGMTVMLGAWGIVRLIKNFLGIY